MQAFAKQFIGAWFWRVILAALVLHTLAFFIRDTSFEWLVLIVIGLTTLVIAYRSLPDGLMIAFAELFAGGHGHLLDAEVFGFSVSLRMAVFGAVMLAWLILWIKLDLKPSFLVLRDVPWALLAFAVVLGTIIGFSRNEAGVVFDDMNGYVTMVYLLPIISIAWTQTQRRDLLQVLFGSATWLAGFTLVLSYLFTHLDGKSLHALYTFVRDSRLAEITMQVISTDAVGPLNRLGLLLIGDGGYYYRIFMQSQFFVMIAFLLITTAMFFIWRNQRMPELALGSLVVFLSTLMFSMSRSFILGIVAGSMCIFVFAFFVGKRPVVNVAKRSIGALGIGAVALGLTIVTVVFPLPQQPNIEEASFYSTSEENTRELAVSSRWSLLEPMMDTIYERPVLGSGFGTEVTYVSDDPRIRDILSDGVLTTYRFEWGYQDIWLKMGLIGLAAFVFYVISIFLGVKYSAKRHGHSWIVIGLGLGVVALYVTHIFSPYLNHPIGLSFMLFILPFIDWEGLQASKKGIKGMEGIQGIKDELQKQKITTPRPVVTSRN